MRDKDAYQHFDAIYAECEALQARVAELEAAHDKNIRKAYSTRQITGSGHHCMWREAAEAMEQRARAALAAEGKGRHE